MKNDEKKRYELLIRRSQQDKEAITAPTTIIQYCRKTQRMVCNTFIRFALSGIQNTRVSVIFSNRYLCVQLFHFNYYCDNASLWCVILIYRENISKYLSMPDK